MQAVIVSDRVRGNFNFDITPRVPIGLLKPEQFGKPARASQCLYYIIRSKDRSLDRVFTCIKLGLF